MQARAHASYPPFAFQGPDAAPRAARAQRHARGGRPRRRRRAAAPPRHHAYDNLEAASATDGLETTSCVVFAGDPSLRFGDALRIMQLWRDEPRNAVVV
jgi:hypothetical protein